VQRVDSPFESGGGTTGGGEGSFDLTVRHGRVGFGYVDVQSCYIERIRRTRTTFGHQRDVGTSVGKEAKCNGSVEAV